MGFEKHEYVGAPARSARVRLSSLRDRTARGETWSASRPFGRRSLAPPRGPPDERRHTDRTMLSAKRRFVHGEQQDVIRRDRSIDDLGGSPCKGAVAYRFPHKMSAPLPRVRHAEGNSGSATAYIIRRAGELAVSGAFATCHAIEVWLRGQGFIEVADVLDRPNERQRINELCAQSKSSNGA